MMKQSIKESLFCLLLGLSIIGYMLCLHGCRSAPIPKIDVQTWAGDSANGGISRSQENKTIRCDEPSMDNYVCMSYEDLKEIVTTMLQCKEWSTTLMTQIQKRRFYKKNQEVIDHAIYKSGPSSR